MDITPFLDKKSKTPLYEQLYAFFKQEISHARITKGTKLPSKRRLSGLLGVSTATIERAYEQLTAEGYVKSKPKIGWFAAEVEADFPAAPAHFQQSMQQALHKESAPAIDFHQGNVDPANFPFNAWRKSIVKSLDRYSKSFHTSGDPQGEPELRQMIARFVRLSRGVHCEPGQIVIGAGTTALLQILCLTLDPGTKIGFEEPGFHRSRRMFEANHMNVIPICTDEEGVLPDELKRQNPYLMYTTPSHQFPLGSIMTITRRQELLAWAKEANTFIIEDDYDGEFRYSGQPIPSLQGLDPNGRVIYLGTFSKSLLPSLRLSYMVLPPALMEPVRKNAHLLKQTVSSHSQLALADFIESGEWQKHVNRMRALYRKKHAVLLEAIRSELGSSVEVLGKNSGLHILLRLLFPASEEEAIKAAADNGVTIYPVSPSYKGRPPFVSVLIGYGGLSEENIRLGIQKLQTAWTPLIPSC
ncbi:MULTISPECIES: PLP-dependent aminotransferase family protein [unclassified Bacillus (in: firmicutes)]|uniref:MocR-like pyridoxine biosynthesis transcription factor PdxR n=2 Tax=Bacillus TaxID=1386 RepID=UPI0022832697|nr:PLP-dependent aminotransferase family protein [Bacillus sp. S20C3]MCY8289217.1 PLP-dependent aminotransferase family protein [Bacillus sp. N13C7]MCY8636397.1 PLP-dependent aminotransferase family protein [Bacillus sp. S17B2]MCY9144010.1 PLP-dependent aminotransferase family protein [Bacillus sp. T9C1]